MSSQLSIWVISAETWIFWSKYLFVENIFEALHVDRIWIQWLVFGELVWETDSRAVTRLGRAG